jgi:molybdate transport system regulatory protein
MTEDKVRRYSNINLHYSIWMTTESGENVISDERMLLLFSIKEEGSLRAGALKMNISYRKAWGDLKETEKLLGFPLIEKHRGGKDGGSTVLTEEGIRLIDAYQGFRKEFQEAVNKVIINFKKTLKHG